MKFKFIINNVVFFTILKQTCAESNFFRKSYFSQNKVKQIIFLDCVSLYLSSSIKLILTPAINGIDKKKGLTASKKTLLKVFQCNWTQLTLFLNKFCIIIKITKKIVERLGVHNSNSILFFVFIIF